MSPPDPGSRRIFTRTSVEDDVERELDAHLALRADELVGRGWSREEAEAEAARLLGDRASISRASAQVVRSHHRAVRRARILETITQDLRYGMRTVVRSPGFALVAIVTLGLGIGANTAIFSVVDGVLLSPLPYPDAQELMVVQELRHQGGTMAVAWPNFVDWKRENSVFDALFAYGSGTTTVLGGETPVTATVAVVSVDIWSALGVTPLQGRLTTESDHVEGAPPVLLVRESFWRNELGGRPLGSIVLDVAGQRASVVGVLPDAFAFPAGASLWGPIEAQGQSSSRSAHNWRVVGRLADGVSAERAGTEMNALTQRLVAADGEVDDEFLAAGAVVRSLQEQIVGDARTPLLILLGAAGLVLLVACTNLASTLLARGSIRLRELAVRASMGAGPGRLTRQLLTESAVLAAVGAALGLGLATGLVRLVKRLGPEAVPRLAEVGVDGSVVLFTAGVAALTVLLFGLVPAVRHTRSEAVDVLRTGSRGNAGGGGAGWSVLVGSEVALALVLLVGSGLLVRSFRSLLAEDTGIDPTDVITAQVALSLLEYGTEADQIAFYDRALAELDASPAVSAAGVLSGLPLGGGLPNGRIELDDDVDKQTVAEYAVASAGAFEALDVPLLQGRLFEPGDTPEQPHVAIVSESFARAQWPGESAIGHSVTGGGMDNYWEDRKFARIVGVVGDVRYRDLGREPSPTIYFPYTQRPFRIMYGANLVVEAANGRAASAGPVLRETIQRLDPDVPVSLVTQEETIGASMAARQFSMLLLTGFSLVALLLAVVGIYGVVSYSVARRRREMGIRLALGAAPGGVVGLVVRSAMGVVVAGLVVGVGGAALGGRVLRGMLYGVGPMDASALAAGLLILGTAGLLASWVPAALGTRVDPMITMRSE